MKKILLLLICLPFLSLAQENLLTEDFNYSAGGLIANSSANWANNSGTAGTLVVSSGDLSYSGYNLTTQTGGKAEINKIGSEDGRRYISSFQTSGKVYVSFLINVTAAQAAGDYFFHYADNSTSYKGRIYIKSSGAGFDIGLVGDATQSGGAVPTALAYTGNTYSLNTTYLIVLTYKFNPNTNDDETSLYVNPDLSSGLEPSSPTLGPSYVSKDLTSLQSVCMRQGTAANMPNLSIDGIKVGTTWSTSVLPISLSSFSAQAVDETVLLNWTTIAEENNDYFEILHSADGKKFSSIGNVKGAGTSAKLLNYSFRDINPSAGTNYYQLLQHDFNGKTSASKIIALNAKIAKAQLSVYGQSGNININLSSPNQSKGQLQLLDILGRKIAEQSVAVNKGYNSFSLSANTQPGIHFVKYITEGVSIFQKFIIK
jgi:hypothetical protein